MKNEHSRTARTDSSSGPSGRKPELGTLPVWNLDDLYPAPDSAELQRDFEWLEAACRSFAEIYVGCISSLDAEGLLKRFEERERVGAVVGRILSFASLLHAQGRLTPASVKFLGDCESCVSELKCSLASGGENT